MIGEITVSLKMPKSLGVSELRRNRAIGFFGRKKQEIHGIPNAHVLGLQAHRDAILANTEFS